MAFRFDGRPPNSSPATDASKNAAVRNLGCVQPVIDGLFNPIRHRYCADMPAVSYEINDGPMIFPPLNVVEI